MIYNILVPRGHRYDIIIAQVQIQMTPLLTCFYLHLTWKKRKRHTIPSPMSMDFCDSVLVIVYCSCLTILHKVNGSYCLISILPLVSILWKTNSTMKKLSTVFKKDLSWSALLKSWKVNTQVLIYIMNQVELFHTLQRCKRFCVEHGNITCKMDNGHTLQFVYCVIEHILTRYKI